MMTPPRNSDPVSPMNICAGWWLKTRKPSIPASRAAASTVLSASRLQTARSRVKAATVAQTEEASPSSPSVRLVALTKPTMTSR